jgi:hypothetical protein
MGRYHRSLSLKAGLEFGQRGPFISHAGPTEISEFATKWEATFPHWDEITIKGVSLVEFPI